MVKMIQKLKMLNVKSKIAFAIALLLSLALAVAIPVYAWFHAQRKAAEMYKVEFPNALYLNAAHREDRVYFNMNAIGPYKVDPSTNGLAHDDEGHLIQVTKQQYVFSVSGSNTTKYIMQLAHTNNNQFTFKIYSADQYNGLSDIPSGISEDRIVAYSMHANSHTENDLQKIDDEYNDSETGMKYYVRAETPKDGDYQNKADMARWQALDNDDFYSENYGALTNVNVDDIPLYWQSDEILVNYDSNKKFSDYYILEVTWEKRENQSFEDKETDMVYISAERK